MRRSLTDHTLPAILPVHVYTASQRAWYLVVAHFLTEWALVAAALTFS